MKKHLIAAAVAAAVAVPAAAQVTITGNMDIAQTQSKTTVSNNRNNAAETSTVKAKGILGNGGNSPYSSSMIKLDATEDLGGGLKAFATHEVSLNNTGTGEAQGGSFGASRQSFVGVSGGFGAISIGYQYAHEHNVLNGAGNAGTNNSTGTLQSGNSGLGKITRHDMIQWTSPKVLGGLDLIVQWGDMEGTSARSDQSPDRDAAGSEFRSSGFNYGSGPLVLRGGYSQQDVQFAENGSAATPAAVNIDVAILGGYTTRLIAGQVAAGGGVWDVKAKRDNVYFGANYNLGSVKLFANFADRDSEVSGSVNRARVADIDANARSYDIGVQVNIGSSMLFGSVGNGEYKQSAAGVAGFQEDVDAYMVGVYHALSKRTGLYALTGQLKFKETTAAQANRETAKVTQTSVGVRHSF